MLAARFDGATLLMRSALEGKFKVSRSDLMGWFESRLTRYILGCGWFFWWGGLEFELLVAKLQAVQWQLVCEGQTMLTWSVSNL